MPDPSEDDSELENRYKDLVDDKNDLNMETS